MFLPEIRNNIKKNLVSIPGWSTSRKIVVIESDDWGSIRTTSIDAVNRLSARGIDFTSLDAKRYSYNDTLASAEDLAGLFDVLISVKDRNNHPAIFTAISLVANPDFKRIKNSGFKEYFYEPFTETLKKFAGCEGSFDLWKSGIEQGIFIPQFHGREHLNVTAWMYALKNGHSETMDVFNEGMWGYVNSHYMDRKINYQEAYNIHDPAEIQILKSILEDGLNLFESIFGYRATFFVAPNGLFSNEIEETLAMHGIHYIAQAKIQNEAKGYGNSKKVYHYMGMKNRWGQVYLTRNCFFEPGSALKTNWVDSCINDIKMAFRWRKPAIISSHRVNYVGSLNRTNRVHSLRQLSMLLGKIIEIWPEVEFLSSDQLGSLIRERK